MRTMRLVVAAGVALGSLAIDARSAGAQEAGASPFHAGQWGIEAYATPNNGGLLYFLTSQTALVLTGTGQRTTTTQDLNPGTSKTIGASFDLALGLRHHKTFAPGMAFIAGGGAFVGSVQQRNEFMGGTSRYRTGYYGGYGEIGGQYMPMTHFSIGLTYRLDVRRTTNKNIELTGVGIGTEFMPVRVSLYF
jgi:hypothetical protein